MSAFMQQHELILNNDYRAPAEAEPVHRKKVSTTEPLVQSPKGKARVSDASPLANLPAIIEKEAGLYFWDNEEAQFVEHGTVTAKILQGPSFETWLTASSDEGQLLAHKISANMNQRWTSKMRSLTWNHFGEDQVMTSWVLRFAGGPEDYEAFLKTFTQALWETLYQTAWGKIKVGSSLLYVLPVLMGGGPRRMSRTT